MTLLEKNLREAFDDSFKFIEIDVHTTDMTVNIHKLKNTYLLDYKYDRSADTLVWFKQIERRGHLFRIYYSLDGEVHGTQEAIEFAINRIHSDFSRVILKQG